VSDRVFSIDWTGEELVVLAGRLTAIPTWYDGVELLRLRPGERAWRSASREPAELELSGQAADAAWDGERLVVVTYAPSAGAWDPDTDTWSAVPRPPFAGAEDTPTVVATGGGGVVAGLGDDHATLTAGGTAWTALPGDGIRTVVPSGDVLIGQGPVVSAGELAVPEPALEVLTAIGR
jgi:hypothetical protein